MSNCHTRTLHVSQKDDVKLLDVCAQGQLVQQIQDHLLKFSEQKIRDLEKNASAAGKIFTITIEAITAKEEGVQVTASAKIARL